MFLTSTSLKANKTLKVVAPPDAFRLCVKAVMDDDAASLAKAVGSTQLPIEMAMSVAAQAWRKDIISGKVGDRMGDGGLLSAVYVGVMRAQEAGGVDTKADNATTLVASLASREDDPRLLRVLMEWDPHFRMGPADSKATIDTTAQFFLEMGAPKCAAHLMDHKDELMMAPRNSFLDEHAKQRVVRNAKSLLAKGAPLHPVTVAALEQLLKDDGKIPVINIANGDRATVCSIGLALLGRAEILAVCSAANARNVEKQVQKLINDSARGDACNLPDAKHFVQMGEDHFLVRLTDATKHLRSSGTSAIVFLKSSVKRYVQPEAKSG